MTTTSSNALSDIPIHPRLVAMAGWTTVLMVFAYVDLFSLYRPDVRAALAAGEIGGFAITDTFLVMTTVYVGIASVMIVASLLLPARAGRLANLVVPALYALTIGASAIGEPPYFLLGSAVEVVVLAIVARSAWTWPRPSSEMGTDRSGSGS